MQDDHHLQMGFANVGPIELSVFYGLGGILDQAIAICCQFHDYA